MCFLNWFIGNDLRQQYYNISVGDLPVEQNTLNILNNFNLITNIIIATKLFLEYNDVAGSYWYLSRSLASIQSC